MNAPAARAVAARAEGRRIPGPLLVLLGALALLLAGFASLGLGARTIAPADVVGAVVAFDGSASHVAVAEVRLPRTILAIVVGGTLGMAGVLMQVITRNPLADPSLLGVSWGAALAVVAGQAVFAVGSPHALVPLAMGGAALAGLIVAALGLAGRGALARERLVVAGAAISGLLAALVQGILVVDRQSLEVARRWLAGSLVGADWSALVAAAPYAVVGVALAVALAPQFSALGLGDDVARGLGVHTGRVKAAGALAVVALAGSSVALAGPLVLIGLLVPHAARALVGQDVAPQFAASAVLGGVLVLLADIVGRVAIAPEELPVGVLTAIMGAPLLLHLARGPAR